MSRIRTTVVLTFLAIVTGFSINVKAGPRDLKPVKADVIEKMTQAMPDEPIVLPKKSFPIFGKRPERKVMVFYLCDGFYHGSIPAINKFVEILGEKTGAYKTDISQDINIFTPEKLAEYEAIIFNNTTKIRFKNDEQKKALMDFVKNGKGIVGIHGASDNFYDFPEAAAMIGGLFDGHPWTANGTWSIKLDETDHPLNKGFEGGKFKIKDEIYQIKGPYSRDTHRVLLTLDLEDEATGKKNGKRKDKDYAVSWIKKCGEGRVFYCGLGHNDSVFFHKGVVNHFISGIQYAIGDLKADDTPSNKK
ncbi:hypothetical protein BVX94_02000 [bacterium B17]|nr:hypothetical protein BVX94_02000 [bacterium B17]